MWGQQMSCEQNRYQDKITSGVWTIKKKKKCVKNVDETKSLCRAEEDSKHFLLNHF